MNAWLDAWSEAMLRASWQGGLVLLAVWGICAAFRRANPGAKCWLWRLGCLKFPLAMLALLQLSMPLLPAERREIRQEPAFRVREPDRIQEAPMIPIAESMTSPEITTPEPSAPASPTPVAAPPAPVSRAPIAARRETSLWLAVGFALWLLGMAFSLAHLIRAWRRTRVLRSKAFQTDSAALLALCETLRADLRMRRTPALLITHDATGPLLTGIFRPAILLPEALVRECRPAQLNLILAHELAHHKRRDIFWNSLQAGIETLFFFHPLIWLARRQSRHLQELACDELTLAITKSEPAAYGQTLLDVLARHPAPRVALAGVGVADSANNLRRRLLAMKNFQPARRHARLIAVTVVIAAALCLPQWRVVAQYVPPQAAPTSPPPIAPDVPTSATSSAAGGKSGIDPARPSSDSVKIDLSDKVITQTFTSRFPRPTAVEHRDLLVGQGFVGKTTKVTADESTNSLQITGTSANVHRLAEILARWEFEQATNNNASAGGPGWQTGPRAAPIRWEDMPPAVYQFTGMLNVPIVAIQSPKDGRVTEVLVKEGALVKTGAKLFQLDDRAARAARESAEVRLDSATIALKQARIIQDPEARDMEMARAENDMRLAKIQLELAHMAVADLAIFAPMDGAIQTFNVQTGQTIAAGANLTSIAGIDQLQAKMMLPAGVVAELKTGQTFTLRAEQEPPATGEIDFISATADPATNMFLVRGKVLSGDRVDRLKSGMKVSIYIRAAADK